MTTFDRSFGGDEPLDTSTVPATSGVAAVVVPGQIELDACLGPGTADSRRLLIAWFVKKSFYWMFFGGAAFASLIHFVERVENDFQVNYRSPESVEHGLLSAWVFVVLAVLIRVAIAWVAIFTVVLGFLIFHWDLYWAGFFSLFDPTRNTLWDWVFLILLIFGVSIWHELGHGFTCKRYGGEVHDIGFALFYFRSVAPPGVTTGDIYRSIVPFVVIQVLGIGLLALFPPLATWLPDVLF